MGARKVRRGDDEADRGTLVTPSAEFPPLGPEERAALSRIGERWARPPPP